MASIIIISLLTAIDTMSNKILNHKKNSKYKNSLFHLKEQNLQIYCWLGDVRITRDVFVCVYSTQTKVLISIP